MISEKTLDQERALEKLGKLKCGALFTRMGTGKSRMALDLIASKIHKVDLVLWLCPCALKGEIENERLKWHPELTLTVIGVESISQSDRIYLDLLAAIKDKKVFCVVDESLKIKNVGAKRTKRILDLGRQCEYRLILNGTPISKGAIDLWTQMDFLSPKILKMDRRDFCKNYVQYNITKSEERNTGHPRYIVGYKNLDHLMAIISPYVYDAELEIEVRKGYRTRYYYNDCQEEYEAIKKDILGRIADNSNLRDFDFYELCSRLQRCYTQSVSKDEVICDILRQIDDKVIVFVRYLSSIPADAPCLTGEHTVEQRQKIISDFREGKFKVLFITYGVGAYGLNLQFCHNVIFAEHMFDYAAKIQAEARVYRMGQESDVQYWDVVCRCGMEDLIIRCIDKKSSLVEELNKGINELGVKEWLKSL